MVAYQLVGRVADGVRPRQGWEFSIDDEEADEIEIDFRFEDGTRVGGEIELDD